MPIAPRKPDPSSLRDDWPRKLTLLDRAIRATEGNAARAADLATWRAIRHDIQTLAWLNESHHQMENAECGMRNG